VRSDQAHKSSIFKIEGMLIGLVFFNSPGVAESAFMVARHPTQPPDRFMTCKGLPVRSGLAEVLGMSEETPSYGAVTPFEVLVHHFESNNFGFHADPESQTVQFFISGDYAVYNGGLQLAHDSDLIQVRAHYPVSARDPKIRPLVAEALARVNYGMSIGNFDIDMDSGEISYYLG
jgi:hypothetical protein